MTQKFKILVTRKWPKKVEESLTATFDTTLNVEDKPLSESELIEAMKSYDALLPTVTDPITEEDKAQQADLHYLLAFAHFQSRDYAGSNDQLSLIHI